MIAPIDAGPTPVDAACCDTGILETGPGDAGDMADVGSPTFFCGDATCDAGEACETCPADCGACRRTPLVSEGFEEASPPGQTDNVGGGHSWRYNVEFNYSGNAAVRDCSRAREGSCSLRSVVDRDMGRSSYRTELRWSEPQPLSNPSDFIGTDTWYGISVYLPSDFVIDRTREILVQWRPLMDPDEFNAPSPLSIGIQGTRWEFQVVWDANRMSTSGYPNGMLIPMANIETGVWTDWVIHIRWSYTADGLVEIWKNGAPELTHSGPNTFNNRRGPTFKFGVYKWPWKTGEPRTETSFRAVFHDAVRVGASYEDVAPGI